MISHKAAYVETAMWVWLIATIFAFYNFHDEEISIISIKSFFFITGGVFILSPLIGFIFTSVLGIYIKTTNKEYFNSDDVVAVIKVGKFLKFCEIVTVFFATIYCFKAVYVA